MKLKTIYLLGMLLSAVVCIYCSFEAKAVVPLWSWFGYKFSMGNPLDNWAPKLSFAIFLFFFIREVNKESKESIA
jgi:hypothetical protein